MTCSCEFSPWLKDWVTGFGTAGGLVALGLILLLWGSRKVNNEHFTKQKRGVALLLNWPAFLLMSLGTVVILFTLIKTAMGGLS